MINDLISIIVPVYNLSNELVRCVRSIQNQSYKNIEIILIDDGSTDDSKIIMKELALQDNRIITFFKKNGGVTSARLLGVKNSSGKYIGFVDGDDEIENDMYELLLKNARLYDAEISHCGYQMCFANGKVSYFYNSGVMRIQDSNSAVTDLLEGSLVEPGLCNKLFKRELFNDILLNNRIDKSIKINEDLLMNYYLFKQINTAVFEDRCLYHYIVRNTSASRQKLNTYMINDPIRVKQLILDDCKEELKITAEKALVNTAIYGFGALSMEAKNVFIKEKKEIRNIICKHKFVISRLPKRTAILGRMIVYVPRVFMKLYPIYIRRFQVKKYE